VTLPVLVVLGALALVVAVTVAPRLEVRSPVVAMVRVLVPSWRFFDTVGEHPQLLARSVGADGTGGPWRPVLEPPTRSWWNVAWHPQGNLSLARHSLLDRLLADVAGDPDEPVSSLVTYRLVLDQVRWSRRGGAAGAVQFKLTGAGGPGSPTLFESEVHDR
jgi:hypothetical protein